MLRSKWSYGAVILVGALTLAACSSSSKSASSSGTTAATSNTGAAGSTGQTPKGTPIEVEEILSFPSPGEPGVPQIQASIQAHFDAVNAAGGIDGRPVKLIECHDQGDPNQSRTCADQAAANKNVVATVFTWSNNDNIIDPILEAAGMAQAGIDPQGSSDLTCSVCFPFFGGGISDTIALGTLLHLYEGVDKLAMMIPNVPVAQAEENQAKAAFLALDPQGSVKEQFLPLTVANYDPYVAATEGYQGTALFDTTAADTAWLKTAHSLGIKMHYGVIGEGITPEFLQQGGSLLNGTVVSEDTEAPTSNVPGAVLYRSEVAKYAPGTAPLQFGLLGWMSAKFFTDIATTISGPITRASVLAAMRNVTNYTGFGGLIGPYTTSKKSTILGGTAPDLYNTNVVPTDIQNGKEQTLSSGFLDPFTGKIING
jgi:branched-chain amino acid transport system substrate-binding protein